MEEKNILDVLYDEKNDDPITLYTEEDVPVVFEQEAIIPYEGTQYCILVPQDPAAIGIGEDEAVVFAIVEDAEEPYLEMETDDAVIDGVFRIYDQLCADEERMEQERNSRILRD